MNPKSMDLVWIVADDLKAAVKYYTEVVGLKLTELNEQFGWAELEGSSGGAKLGIGQKDLKCDKTSGIKNAVMTFTVKNLEETTANMAAKGAEMVGGPEEVPGHVKMQMVKDIDGNCFQLVEVLAHKCCHC